jgi:hypothetical protein
MQEYGWLRMRLFYPRWRWQYRGMVERKALVSNFELDFLAKRPPIGTGTQSFSIIFGRDYEGGLVERME